MRPKSFQSAPLCLAVVLSLISISGCSSGTSNSSGGGGGTTTTPTPAVTSISPTTVAAGTSGLTLTVNGSNFQSGTTVQVGGSTDATTYVSATQLTVAVQASQITAGGLLSVIAVTGSTSSGSGTLINLEVDNPVPSITALSPSTVSVGATSPQVSVTGKGFDTATVIQVNGSPRATSFVSGTQVNVTLTAADVAVGGSVSLTAVNPTPGGGTSSAVTLGVSITAPGTSIGVVPNIVIAGTTPPSTLSVTGTNFAPTSVVQLNGAPQATTFVSTTQLSFQLTTAEQATIGIDSITVVTPYPGGGSSAISNLFVVAATATPTITSVQPTQFVVGSTATIAVYGTGFTASLGTNSTLIVGKILWNGTTLPSQNVGSTGNGYYLTATVPASLLAALGTAQVTVSSSTATPAASNAVTVTIGNPPPPTLTSISPSSGPINTATTVALYGTGFTSGSTVTLNGISIPATYVNSTQLTVAIPATSLILPGNVNFAVTTPAPGGGTSGTLPYTAYIGIVNNSMVYNPVNGFFYVSVPSTVGAPYGNSVVSVDPASGALGTPILVGSEPDRLAISSDGTTLWVGLDGASAVRQVNLTTGTAGLQFSLAGNSGVYATPGTVSALAVLPGSPNSVVVATSTSSIGTGVSLGIFDSGVLRGTGVTGYTSNTTYGLQVDGTKGEVYAAGSSTYTTYTYSSSGLTQKATASNGSYGTYSGDDLQVTGGRTYTDFGRVYDAEAGALLGTFYVTGATIASGPTVADTTLGQAFMLDSPQGAGSIYGYSQIQPFDLSTFNAGSSVIPVAVSTSSTTTNGGPSHLTRWGTNGLAFRTSQGVYSLQSNVVKNLSTTNADLSVAVVATGATTTGGTSTFTATITNNGPAAATNVVFAAQIPSTSVLISGVPSAGSCSTTPSVSCDLRGVANGGTVTVTIAVQETTAGPATLSAQVYGSETDPVLSNNQASATATITGSNYNSTPAVSSISPAAIQSGSTDTVITVTGSGFASGSIAYFGTTALTTSVTNSTALTATVPAAKLASLGWGAVTVQSPLPGGGTSNATPLSVFSVITLGVNHILYDPYSRNVMASVGSGSGTVAGNSIVAIQPDTATVGTAVAIGSQPTNLALTSDGQILYTILAGSQSVARYNMLTQTADYTYAVPAPANSYGGVALRGIAAQPGTENTIALDIASFTGNAIYDFNPAAKTAAIRGQVSGPYSGSCIQFPDATNFLAFDTDTSGSTFDHYTVTTAGFTYYNYQQYTESTLNHFGCFQAINGIAYSISGGVASYTTPVAQQLGVFQLPSGYGYSGQGNVAPDPSLQRVFFAVNSAAAGFYSSSLNSLQAYDANSYLPSYNLPLPLATIEGNTTFSGVDLIRWGRDGLALLTNGGHIYLVRGAAVVPGLLGQSSAAVLTSSSASSITHGAGNTLLTLTGSNFLPGVAVTWNGSYRTTIIVDATHVTVAIPASDLAITGSGSLVATNPGAIASSVLTITVN